MDSLYVTKQSRTVLRARQYQMSPSITISRNPHQEAWRKVGRVELVGHEGNRATTCRRQWARSRPARRVVRVGEARIGAYLPFIFCIGMDPQSVRSLDCPTITPHVVEHKRAPHRHVMGRLYLLAGLGPSGGARATFDQFSASPYCSTPAEVLSLELGKRQ